LPNSAHGSYIVKDKVGAVIASAVAPYFEVWSVGC